MTGRSLRKCFGAQKGALVHSTVRTKGKLEKVTVIPIVSVAVVALKPAIVFPEKQAHYCRLNGQLQTLHTFLPPCHLYQREIPGVESAIILACAQKFID